MLAESGGVKLLSVKNKDSLVHVETEILLRSLCEILLCSCVKC